MTFFGSRVIVPAAVALLAASCAAPGGPATSPSPTPSAAAPASPTPSTSPTSPIAAVVVKPGDRVQVSGVVLTEDQVTKACAPAAVTLEYPPRQPCPVFVPATGVDTGRLSTRYGEPAGTLIGTWDGTTLAVSDQEPPQGPRSDVRPLPCDPPEGGWATEVPPSYAAIRYVKERPQTFAEPWIAHPDGEVSPAPTSPAGHVLVVEVVDGDVDTLRTELTRRFGKNMCVVAADRPSGAELDALVKANTARLAPLMKDPEAGILSAGMEHDEFVVSLVKVTPELAERLEAAGLQRLRLEPWMRPAA